MKVLRFESSLYFGNVERFRSALIAVVGRDPGVQQHTRKEVKLQSGDKAELLENEQEDDFSDNQEIPNGVRNSFFSSSFTILQFNDRQSDNTELFYMFML